MIYEWNSYFDKRNDVRGRACITCIIWPYRPNTTH